MLPGLLLDDRYLLEAEAGSGGMGTVWRARDTRIERTVAIKVLHSHLGKDEQLRVRFDREARAIGGLQHPGVVQLHDFTETRVDGKPVAYLVMEYVPGPSLAALLARRERLGVADTLTLIASAADALHAAHARGVVHRDVKPGNILVNDGVAKIVDFGISQSHGEQRLTVTGNFMGSLHYVSPEQLQGRTLTAVSDVYSLGVVAYEALTGELPFPGDTPASVLTGHLQREPRPFPPDIPGPVANVVLRALAKDPEARFGSAAALAEACRDTAVFEDDGQTVPLRTMTAPVATTTVHATPSPQSRRRRRLSAVAAALGAVLLTAAAVVLVTYLREEAADARGDGGEGVARLVELTRVGDPVPFEGSDAKNRGAIPEPVITDGAAFFVHYADGAPEAVAVELDSGTQRWRQPLDEPIGVALRAGRDLLYLADTESGVLTFLDPKTGESRGDVDFGTSIEVTTAGSLVLVFVAGEDCVTAFDAEGEQAWQRCLDSPVIDVDIEAEWIDFTNQPGRVSQQEPDRFIAYGDDGAISRLELDSGDVTDTAGLDADLSVTSAFEDRVFVAEPRDDGYSVTMLDNDGDFEEVGRWESLHSGQVPEQIEWCGKKRVCVHDRLPGGDRGAVVIDFGEPSGEPAWQSPAEVGDVGEIYAAGDTTAVVTGGESPSTKLYDETFEPLGRDKPGTFRPIDERTFLDYPRLSGTAPDNRPGEHFFTALDAQDGSTRDLGRQRVFPQCVTDGDRVACPTPDGITVWRYRKG